MSTLAVGYSGLVSARERLRTYVDRALTRLRAQEAINSLLVVLSVSLCSLVIFLLADKYFSLKLAGINVWIVWGGVTALGIPYVLWRIYSPRLHENLAAVLADDRLGLNARLCTALTLDLHDEAAAEFSEAFFAEALGRLERLNVEQAFPVRVPRTFALLLIPAAACFAIQQFMPYQDRLGLVKAREEKRKAENVRQKAAALLEGKLDDLKKRVEDPTDEKAGVYKVKQLIQQAGDVARELRDGKRNPEEAVIALGQLKNQIKEEREKVTQGKEFLDRLEKLSAKDLSLEETALTKEVSEALKMADPGRAAQEIRKLAQKVKNDILNDPNKSDEQKQKQLEQLQREVEKLAGALAEDEALREGLQELSEQVMSSAEFQKLQDAIKKQLEKDGKGNQQQGKEIQRQMEELAEELERLEEDNDANLSEDEQDEMEQLDNVEEAIDDAMNGLINPEGGQDGGAKPGGQPGGKKQGGGKPKLGQKGGKAAGNKQGRMAGKGRGGQEGGKEGKQGGGKGGQQGEGDQQGRPGDGLGGGKGIGHRPYRDVADPGFQAEKVKGKMQAGAITGLSHFRGQGAKGEAPMEFVQALTAAEQEASSSLELDRIPADARETVKDYFLNVRKGANLPPAPTPPAAPAAPDKKAAPAPPAGPKKEALKE